MVARHAEEGRRWRWERNQEGSGSYSWRSSRLRSGVCATKEKVKKGVKEKKRAEERSPERRAAGLRVCVNTSLHRCIDVCSCAMPTTKHPESIELLENIGVMQCGVLVLVRGLVLTGIRAHAHRKTSNVFATALQYLVKIVGYNVYMKMQHYFGLL